MKKMLRLIFQYSLLFIVLLIISIGVVRLFGIFGLSYTVPSTVAFCSALFATLILMLINKTQNKSSKKTKHSV